MSSGYVDLHCHYLPAVDDGVRTRAESVELLTGLAKLGWATVIATPHIRTAMFENRKAPLQQAFEALRGELAGELPGLGLAAEHYWDDVVWHLFSKREALPYPGERAALVEFHYDTWPMAVERRFFDLRVRGITPVIAHPERYAALARRTDPLDPLLEAGAVTLLDLMSLVGRYGERSRLAAERLLEEGAYDAACTDCHRPGDVAVVEKALETLHRLVGREEAEALLAHHPRAILDGDYDP